MASGEGIKANRGVCSSRRLGMDARPDWTTAREKPRGSFGRNFNPLGVSDSLELQPRRAGLPVSTQSGLSVASDPNRGCP